MNWLEELSENKSLSTDLAAFFTQYGPDELKQALQLYEKANQNYICKTKSSLDVLKICDIYYLQIAGHTITVHTQDRNYQKYGTLSKELQALSQYGFIKCNQSCLISLDKVKSITGSNVLMENGDILHLSRNCTSKVIMAFSQY
ncbi:MAG: LytTR family DNA-binding domain-containing protein [Eubacteriales bacterium]|nr:LytTR family DNA-binding domain-containing protein [Eubacteriales bacterium]